jgi:regulator of cell morphogenesis and NO signaling
MLVERNYIVAAVLHHFGISFYQNLDKSLDEVCRERNLDPTVFFSQLEKLALRLRNQEPPENLGNFPIQVILDYLYHTHRVFIRQQLPYMAQMIDEIKISAMPRFYRPIVEDLKIAFPLFADDFIRHIFDEEEHLFEYITLLERADLGEVSLLSTYFHMERCSIAQAAEEHLDDDDEMQGIRLLTHNYHLAEYAPLIIRVLYNELQEFEKRLQIHADIEDKILFPKALKLENNLKERWAQIVPYN